MKNLYLSMLFCTLSVLAAKAQDEGFSNEEGGEEIQGEFVVNKQLKITLPPAQRIFQKVAPEEINARESNPLTYSFVDFQPTLQDIPARLRVLKLKDERMTEKPGSFIKLGIGNFQTPYLEAALNSRANKKGSYGLSAYHWSSKNGPVDEGNSGDSHSRIKLFGKTSGTSTIASGAIGYQRDGYHFYGYDDGAQVSKDSIRQAYNDISLDVGLKSADAKSALQYDFHANIYNINDHYDAGEFGFDAGLKGNFAISENMEASLGADALIANYKNISTTNRTLFRVRPAFIYRNFGLMMDIGMNILNSNDTLGGLAQTTIYPSIRASYEITDNLSAYAALDGDLEDVTYRKLVKENPYLQSGVPLAHSRKNLDFKIGLNGTLVQYLSFDVGIRSALYKNLYFFVNDPSEFNRFNVLYDQGNTTLFQGHISLSYVRERLLGSTFATRFNAYSTGKIDQAWHRPQFELDYDFWYNFYDKVKFSTDMHVLSGIHAVDFRVDPLQDVKLQAAVDLNVQIDYLLSEKYAVFVSVKNLLNNNYQVYYRYRTRGLLAMVGFSVSF